MRFSSWLTCRGKPCIYRQPDGDGGVPLDSTRATATQMHYGWIIVATSALGLFSCFGLARYAYSMLLLPQPRERIQ